MITVQDFKKEVLSWAEEIGVKPKEIHVRTMKKKWASCSSKGRVSFSYALCS
jgi:predicted metal-dependent hydrolase